MRVLFTPIAGGATPLSYLVPLAWACRAAGHEVRVAAQPTLTAATTRAGLPAVEVGRGHDVLADIVHARGGSRAAEASVKRWDASGAARPGAEDEGALADRRADARRALRSEACIPWVTAAAATAPDLLRFAGRWRPDLVVTDGLVFVASLVSAVLGIPLLRSLWGPDILRRIGYPLQGQPAGGDVREEWPTGLAELFDRYRAEVRNDHPVGTLDPWPGSLQLPGVPGRIPIRFVPYNGASVAPDWVLDRPSRPLVCVTCGTTTTTLGGEQTFILPRVVDALSGLDVEVVLAVGGADRDRLGAVPAGVRVVENLPLHLVMPTCDLIVNQAGAGTLLTAACHGVPQVLMPQTAETPLNAANFAASGAAIAIDAGAGTEAIADAVRTALGSDAMRAAARKISDEIAGAPSPADVVPVLDDLARRGRGRDPTHLNV